MLVAIALANKMARVICAMTIKQEDYRIPVSTTDGMVAALPNRHRNVPALEAQPSPTGKDGKMNDMIVGVDLAKTVFQLHGATADGRPAFRKKVPRQ
ncbi:hypothetical protein SAMN04489859_10699 [Paracoccus alcaliphilus]|uniref:Transposase n=1 Tax=Paracoccus alcaliphilus TaxID=34002 RepID=A0A1H8NSL4_9RHOB|nr:hypothetical protein [Paracoccus alcaliphilus]SEO32617.1 hypothetical protein SAMN04489859_10699 [Paracoccus alcaliphilus]